MGEKSGGKGKAMSKRTPGNEVKQGEKRRNAWGKEKHKGVKRAKIKSQ